MLRQNRPDPYNGFKSDRERRQALNTKVRWHACAWALAALAGAPHITEKLSWLAKLLH